MSKGSALEQLGQDGRDRYASRKSNLKKTDFVSGAEEAKGQLDRQGMWKSLSNSFGSWLTGPLEDFKQYYNYRLILGFATFLICCQVSIFSYSIAFFYKTIDGNYVSMQDGNAYTKCEMVPRQFSQTVYASDRGQFIFPGAHIDNNDKGSLINVDTDFYELDFFAYNSTKEQYTDTITYFAYFLEYLARKTENNTLATNYVYLNVWKERVCASKPLVKDEVQPSGAVISKYYYEETPAAECISVQIRADTFSLLSGVSAIHMYGRDLLNALDCGYQLTYDQQVNIDDMGYTIISFYVNAYTGQPSGLSLPSFPSVCNNFIAPHQLGLYRMMTDIDQSFEYELKIHNPSVMTAVGINMGLISLDTMHISPLITGVDLPDDLTIYNHDSAHMEDASWGVICKTGNLTEGQNVLCGVLIDMGAPFGIGFPAITTGLGYSKGTDPLTNTYCTCKGDLFEGVPGMNTSTCTNSNTPEFNFIMYKPNAYSPTEDPYEWWSKPFDRFYAAVYDPIRNPSGDYQTFSEDVVGLDVQFKAEAFTHSFVHYPTNLTLAAELIEKYNLQNEIDNNMFMSFCDENCVVLQVRTLKSSSSISKSGYGYTNGSCTSVLGGAAQRENHIQDIIMALKAEHKPFRLEEVFKQCSTDLFAKVMRVIPWSMSMMQLFTISFVGIFLSALTAFVALKTKDKNVYTTDQIKSTNKELAFHLLRARDGDMFGIKDQGPLQKLSRDLLRAALYTGGLVDSDDDLDDDDQLEAIRHTLATRAEDKKNKKGLGMGGSSRETFIRPSDVSAEASERQSTLRRRASAIRERLSVKRLEEGTVPGPVSNPMIESL